MNTTTEEKQNNKKIVLLSLDGGGMRGILTTTFLENLSAYLEREPFSWVDMFAGTSTGGLAAAGLACGMPASEVRKIYSDKGKEIFKERTLMINPAGLLTHQYENDGLKIILNGLFGSLTMKDVEKLLFIPAFEMNTYKARFFSSFSDPDSLVRQILLATSAAPTYFEPARIGDFYYCDGGVFATNPTLCAVTELMVEKSYSEKDILVVSVGTGRKRDDLDEQASTSWGALNWVKALLGITMDSLVDLTDYQCKKLLGENYFRFQIDLDEAVKLDATDSETLKLLQSYGNRMFQENIDSIDRLKGILGRE